MTSGIVVAEYDPTWPATFETLRATIWPVVREVALGIEHVGSTSVPALAAKPIIDMILVVPSAAEVALAIDRWPRSATSTAVISESRGVKRSTIRPAHPSIICTCAQHEALGCSIR